MSIGRSFRKIKNGLTESFKWQIGSRSYDLVQIENFAKEAALKITPLVPYKLVKGARPHFWGGDASVDLSIYDGSQHAPEINLIEINDAFVIGRTEFVLKGNKALYPKVINPEMDAFMIEIEKRAKVDICRRRIRMLFKSEALRVDSAISLLGQCNGNYAHWITEALARLALVERLPEFKGLPLLVETPIHGKLLDALDTLNISQRRIIHVREYQKVHARRLIYVTPPSLTPPESREFLETGNLTSPRMDQFQFSDIALENLRETIVSLAKGYSSLPAPISWQRGTPEESSGTSLNHKRIYLRRQPGTTGNGRHLLNSRAVEDELRELGFSGVDMANLAFEDQVTTIQNAEVVVAPIGAAAANLAFCKPGCAIVLLSPFYSNANFFYWANLMSALGHRTLFVLGNPAMSRHGTIYHKDFRIDLRLLNMAVQHALVPISSTPFVEETTANDHQALPVRYITRSPGS